MPLNIATIRAELTGAPSYRIASSPGTPFAILSMGPMHLTSDDPAELRRLADVAANAADVLEAAQREAAAKDMPVFSARHCSHEEHAAMKDARTFRAITEFHAHGTNGDGGILEYRHCRMPGCRGTLAMDKAELDAAEAGAGPAVVP